MEATGLQVALGTQSAQGKVTLAVPGATAQAQGTLAPRSGTGDLQLQWADAALTQRWLAGLPVVGTSVQRTLQGASAQGAAQIAARWKGGWQTLTEQLQTATANSAPARNPDRFDLQATLNTPQLDLTLPATTNASGGTSAGQTLQLRAFKAELGGNLAQASLALTGEVRTPAPQALQTTVQTRLALSLIHI